MSFQDDLDTDRANVFVDATGYGFAESFTHTAASDGTQTTLNGVPEELIFARDNKDDVKFSVDENDLSSPVAGDLISYNGFTWAVVTVRTAGGMHEINCTRQLAQQ